MTLEDSMKWLPTGAPPLALSLMALDMMDSPDVPPSPQAQPANVEDGGSNISCLRSCPPPSLPPSPPCPPTQPNDEQMRWTRVFRLSGESQDAAPDVDIGHQSLAAKEEMGRWSRVFRLSGESSLPDWSPSPCKEAISTQLVDGVSIFSAAKFKPLWIAGQLQLTRVEFDQAVGEINSVFSSKGPFGVQLANFWDKPECLRGAQEKCCELTERFQLKKVTFRLHSQQNLVEDTWGTQVDSDSDEVWVLTIEQR